MRLQFWTRRKDLEMYPMANLTLLDKCKVCLFFPPVAKSTPICFPTFNWDLDTLPLRSASSEVNAYQMDLSSSDFRSMSSLAQRPSCS